MYASCCTLTCRCRCLDSSRAIYCYSDDDSQMCLPLTRGGESETDLTVGTAVQFATSTSDTKAVQGSRPLEIRDA